MLIASLGAGECGLSLLTGIFSRQPNCQAALAKAPLLPWKSDDPGRLIRARVERIRSKATADTVVDCAEFYLPYVEEAIAAYPEIRFVCLKRPMLEAMSGFCQQLDRTSPRAINPWTTDIEGGWSHDFLWGRSYPKWDSTSRYEGSARYWTEYYEEVDELCQRFPDNIRVWDTADLMDPAHMQDMLTFAGIPPESQVILQPRRKENDLWTEEDFDRPKPHYIPDPADPRRCVILVPYQGLIHAECEAGLKELEHRGYTVRRVAGYAAIDQGRNQLATDAMVDGFEEVIWIDSDVAFHPDSVDQLRSHPQEIVCGIYPQKNKRALASHVMPGSKSITFGRDGGLTEILYAGTGFLMIRRQAFLRIFEQLKLPVCNERFGRATIPFFMPMTREIEEASWYLAEDYAFCERARQCGMKIYADTSIRLWHIGNYKFGWEDAGMERTRFGSFTINFGEKPEQETTSERDKRLANFASDYRWPKQRPESKIAELDERPSVDLAELLANALHPATHLILEVGAASGQLTRVFATHPSGTKVIALEPWESDESFPERQLEHFESQCWEHRQRVIPVRSSISEGIQLVADAQLDVNVVMVNRPDPQEEPLETIRHIFNCFPAATVIGSDGLVCDYGSSLEQLATEKEYRLRRQNGYWAAVPSN